MQILRHYRSLSWIIPLIFLLVLACRPKNLDPCNVLAGMGYDNQKIARFYGGALAWSFRVAAGIEDKHCPVHIAGTSVQALRISVSYFCLREAIISKIASTDATYHPSLYMDLDPEKGGGKSHVQIPLTMDQVTTPFLFDLDKTLRSLVVNAQGMPVPSKLQTLKEGEKVWLQEATKASPSLSTAQVHFHYSSLVTFEYKVGAGKSASVELLREYMSGSSKTFLDDVKKAQWDQKLAAVATAQQQTHAQRQSNIGQALAHLQTLWGEIMTGVISGQGREGYDRHHQPVTEGTTETMVKTHDVRYHGDVALLYYDSGSLVSLVPHSPVINDAANMVAPRLWKVDLIHLNTLLELPGALLLVDGVAVGAMGGAMKQGAQSEEFQVQIPYGQGAPTTADRVMAAEAFFVSTGSQSAIAGPVGPAASGAPATPANSCTNGAVNYPACDDCSSGHKLTGGQCEPDRLVIDPVTPANSCTNGATNPPACDQCPTGKTLSGDKTRCVTSIARPQQGPCQNGAVDFPTCVQCSEGKSLQQRANGTSVCDFDQTLTGADCMRQGRVLRGGVCVDQSQPCPLSQEQWGGRCVVRCTSEQQRDTSGACVQREDADVLGALGCKPER